MREWTEITPIEQFNGRNHLLKHGVPVPKDASITRIGPLTIRQLNLFAHKAVLALHFEHSRHPLSDKGRFCAYWRTKEDFARDGIPQFLLDLLSSYGTLVQGRWNERETFEYRQATNDADGLFGCLMRLRRGLFVFGFSATNAEILPPEGADWVKPSHLLSLLDDPRFAKKR